MEETKDTLNEEMTQQETPKNVENEKNSKKEKKHGKHDAAAEQLQEMGEKLAEMNDKYLRLTADFENYRKRMNKDMAELMVNGGKDVIKDMLPIVDDMERALQAMTDENSKQGVTMIYNKLMQALQAKGLKEIEAKGQKFDEMVHEAVTQIPAPSEELKGTVIDVVEKGYYLNDKVLRYAKVVYGM